MSRSQLSQKLEEQVRKSILSYAFFRPESAVVIGLTTILVGLSALNLPWFPGEWWLWLPFGLAGEALIILSTLRDDKFYRQMLANIFRQEFDPNSLRSSELRQKLLKALEYRELIVKEIEREKEPGLDDYLSNIVTGFDDWLAQIYHLARGLDVYQHDPIIGRDMETTPQELERFKRLLAREKDESAQEELAKTIAIKQTQWDTLKNLQSTMAKAQLQLENTLAAMGTLYMQVVLLGAKDVDSSRGQRLQADMIGQVQALEDVSAAMDEVYQASG